MTSIAYQEPRLIAADAEARFTATEVLSWWVGAP
jgi:hypothetical protein